MSYYDISRIPDKVVNITIQNRNAGKITALNNRLQSLERQLENCSYRNCDELLKELSEVETELEEARRN